MPKFWGLHIPIGIGLDVIDKQRVSIGWAKMGDLESRIRSMVLKTPKVEFSC